MTRRNLARNPSVEVDLAWWDIVVNGTIERVANTAIEGQFIAVHEAIGNGINFVIVHGSVTRSILVSPGETLTASVSVKCFIGGVRPMEVNIRWYDTNDVILSTVQGNAIQPDSSSDIVRPFITATAPTGTVYAEVLLRTDAGVIGDNYHWDALLIERSNTVGTYFDGDSSGAFWEGVQHNSTSVLIELEDYEYQYKDVGVLLNSGSTTLPLWDVEKIVGLTDSPDYGVIEQDLDGQHGGLTYARFFNRRVIVVEGTLYSNACDVDNELLRSTLIPDGNSHPFYFNHPGLGQRYVEAKPVGYNADTDRGRRTGKMRFQAQWHCEDPRHYRDNDNVAFTSGVALNLTNDGNTSTHPTFSWKVESALQQSVTIVQGADSINFVHTTAAAGQVMEVDLHNKLIRKDGVVLPIDVTGSWPVQPPGTWAWTATLTGSSSTHYVASRSAWL